MALSLCIVRVPHGCVPSPSPRSFRSPLDPTRSATFAAVLPPRHQSHALTGSRSEAAKRTSRQFVSCFAAVDAAGDEPNEGTSGLPADSPAPVTAVGESEGRGEGLVESKLSSEVPGRVRAEESAPQSFLGCPVCFRPLEATSSSAGDAAAGFNMLSASRFRLHCPSCSRTFPTRQGFADLLLTAGATRYAEPDLPSRSTTFKNPLVSFAYERGWRQSFAGFGFPGADEEFSNAQRLLHPMRGGLLVDLSCGSGLFTRRFAASGDWRVVVAADYSPAMLAQTREFIQGDRALEEKRSRIALVRLDVSRLPFPSASVDAIHAGAALHCWPSPAIAMAEICRVLKPGGMFVATTILMPRAPFADELFKPFRKQLISSQQLPFRYWEADELEELVALAGLTDYTVDIRRQYIMMGARKKGGEEEGKR